MKRVWVLIVVAAFIGQVRAQDAGWPRQVTRDGAVLVYYQPQVDGWKDYNELTANMAFGITPNGGKETLGVASIHCTTIVDKDKRMVVLQDITFPSIRFHSLPADQMPAAEQLFKQLMPAASDPISLDRIMADYQQYVKPTGGVTLNNDPPPIFYSNSPAILLIVDGDPVLSPIEKTSIQFMVNTNWDLFFDKSKKDYYLLENNIWLTAKDVKGPWTRTTKLPKDMGKLPSGQNFDDVKKLVPPPAVSATVPTVFFSDKPAELILLRGTPVYTTIAGTQLLYIDNSDNDVFLDNAKKEFYVLLSGRWFRSASLQGPWAYASNDLPADFSKIPENSAKAHVLASVPGTVEASDAVMLAQIPTTAVVNKADAEAKVKVTYEGTPSFKPIETTTLEYATNTQDKVIKVGDMYYLCFQGVWFMSTQPNGPWKTADSVPKEIYTIPASSPVYNVTYVTQTDATATTVESSTTAGYFGVFVLGLAVGAAIAYGTGWYHPPFIYFGPAYPYPIYHPWPCTYGAGVVYNPWTGGWAAGHAAYGPYAAAGSSAWFNPATGRYGHAATVQGMYGGRTVASGYNPWTGGRGATTQGHNAYSQWGSSVATRNGYAVQTGHVTNANGTTAGYRTNTGQHGVVHTGPNGTTVAHGNNGVYAGHDGNVYKKNSTGNWSQYNNGSWNHVNNNATQRLDQSAQARQRGQTQTSRFQNFQRNGGAQRSGGGRFQGARRR